MKKLFTTITSSLQALMFITLLIMPAKALSYVLIEEVNVDVGSTVTIRLPNTYADVLDKYGQTRCKYTWRIDHFDDDCLIKTSDSKTSATFRGLKAKNGCTVYYDCSFYIDGFYRSYEFKWYVNVKENIVYVTNVSVTPKEATLYEGESLSLSASVYPYNATNKNLRWSSSNPEVASVSYYGYVEAKKEGTATITCSATDGSGRYDKCLVTVLYSENVIKDGETFQIGDICYKILSKSDKTCEVISKTEGQYTGDIVIPAAVEYKCHSLSVMSIGSDTFNECRSLTSVIIPNSVKEIGWRAFRNCTSLTSVVIPNSVTRLYDYTFYNCSSLASITIPSSVASIESNPFEYCEKLTEIKVEKGNKNYFVEGDCLIAKDGKLITGLNKETVVIPNSVTSIYNGAFIGCSNLQSVVIPNTVTSICSEAFRDCSSLKSVELPNSITSIGGFIFYDCCHLTSVTIPSSVEAINSNPFYGCI